MAVRIRQPSAIALACVIPACPAASGGTRPSTPPRQLKASASNDNFEWFFLIMDEAMAQGIWAKPGLGPEIGQPAGPPVHQKERVTSGILRPVGARTPQPS